MPKIISEEILRGIIEYLDHRPHKEVAHAIRLLNVLPEAPSTSDAPAPTNAQL